MTLKGVVARPGRAAEVAALEVAPGSLAELVFEDSPVLVAGRDRDLLDTGPLEDGPWSAFTLWWARSSPRPLPVNRRFQFHGNLRGTLAVFLLGPDGEDASVPDSMVRPLCAFLDAHMATESLH